MLLFRSEEHVANWCAQWNQPHGESFPLSTGWDLAREWYSSDRRDPEWRRKTLDEVESTFARLGFTSDFWSLR